MLVIGKNPPVRATVQFVEAPNQIQTMTVTYSSPDGKETRIAGRSRGSKPPPVGFGTQAYDVEDAKGPSCFEPVIGEQLLDPEKALDCPRDYRFQELTDRLSRGPIEFRWIESDKELGRLTIQKS